MLYKHTVYTNASGLREDQSESTQSFSKTILISELAFESYIKSSRCETQAGSARDSEHKVTM